MTGSPEAPGADVNPVLRHGVPHLVVLSPGPVRARLVFRVGLADERLPQRGLTHLVEHLTMRAVGRRPFEVNAHVGPWSTGFEATGSAQAVTAFVEDVWRVLADLPLADLALEKEVLRIEGLDEGTTPALESLHHRFGVTGPGRAWADEIGLPGASAEDVRAWVSSRFVRGAAALAATADIRPDLTGGPVDGPPSALPVVVAARDPDGPVWVGDAGGTAVSLLLPSRDGLDLAVGRMLQAAAEQVVRHDRALAYEVGMDVVDVSPGTSEVAVYADCEPERHAEVAGLLVDVLRRFRDSGPTVAETDFERDLTTAVWRDTPDALEVAAEAAVALLVGGTPRGLGRRLRDAEELNAALVKDVVRAAWPTLQVLLPVEEEPGIEGVAECRHLDEPLPGRTYRGNPLAVLLPGARVPARPSVSVTAGEHGLTLRLDGEVLSVRWDQVAAVVQESDGLVVVGDNGHAIHLPDGTFWGSRRLRRAVEERLDRSLFVEVPG